MGTQLNCVPNWVNCFPVDLVFVPTIIVHQILKFVMQNKEAMGTLLGALLVWGCN